jgi:hypothetical protein
MHRLSSLRPFIRLIQAGLRDLCMIPTEKNVLEDPYFVGFGGYLIQLRTCSRSLTVMRNAPLLAHRIVCSGENRALGPFLAPGHYLIWLHDAQL